MEKSQNKNSAKYVVLTTYLVAVVCLLLGLFLPLWGGKGILALQLPDVINKLLNKSLLPAKSAFEQVYTVSIPATGKSFDLMGVVALLYTAVTALSLLALIPIGVSTKKAGKVSCVFAYIIEIAAVAVTSVYVLIVLSNYAAGNAVSRFSYNMIVALGGSLLTLIVLCFLNKKGTGAAKFFLFLFSAVATIALFNLTVIVPKLASIGKFSPVLFGNEIGGSDGISYLKLAFEGGYSTMWKLMPAVKDKALMAITTIVSGVVIINYFIDLISLSSNAKKAGHFFNVIRYGIELLAVAALLITVLVGKYTIGIMLMAIGAAVVIQTLISIIRLIIYIKKPHKNTEATQVEYEQPDRNFSNSEPILVEPEDEIVGQETFEQSPEPVYMEQEQPRPRQDKYGFNEPLSEEPKQMNFADIQQSTRQAEQRPVQPVPVQSASPVHSNVADPEVQTRVYTINTIYGGPVDEFMRKLTNDEKIEFAMTFIEKSKGNIGNIPEYVVGGNNRLFFSSVFIYLGRIRGLISDGLLNKMYKELNML